MRCVGEDRNAEAGVFEEFRRTAAVTTGTLAGNEAQPSELVGWAGFSMVMTSGARSVLLSGGTTTREQ